MKLKSLLIATLLLSFLAKAQDLNDENLMGEWEIVNVDRPNFDKVPKEEEALKMFEDVFINSKFIFDEYNLFNMELKSLPDERMMELLLLDYQKWAIQNDGIFIGTDVDRFYSMHITYQESDGKTYFILPMVRLEMEKVSNGKSSKPKAMESTPKTFVDAIPDMAYEEIDENQIIDFHQIENPPLARECKPKWDVEKRKQCTTNFIQQHVVGGFNTDLASELELTGKVRIMSEFVIDTNGKVINVKAHGSHRVMNQHVIDIIKMLPDFRPGTKDEKPTKVSYRLPLVFVVDD